jgi:hypothetical protein
LPDVSALVAVELIGDEVARLLAGETLALPGYVSPTALVHEQPPEPEQPEEDLMGTAERPTTPSDEGF